MDIFRILEEGKILNGIESKIFIGLIGDPKDSKKIRKLEILETPLLKISIMYG